MRKRHQILLYLYEATNKNRIFAMLLIVIEISISLLNIGFVMVMRSAFDSAANKNKNALLYGILSMFLFILLRIIFRAVLRYLDEKVRSSIENNLKTRLIHHILYNKYAQIEAVHTGEWMNRLTSDTTIVANGLTEILPHFFGMIVKLIGATVMIIVMIPQVSYFVFPACIFAIFITWILRKKMKKHHKEVQESDGFVRMFLQERLGSIMIIRAFRAEDIVKTEAIQRMKKHKQARMKRNMISNICNIGFSGLMNSLYLVGFLYCSYGIMLGNISYGTLLAVIQLIGQIQTPFAGLSSIVPRFYSMVASAERLIEVEMFDKDKTNFDLVQYDFSKIILEHISFSYTNEKQQQIFSNLSLSFQKGDYVALTGHSGCGKSTLFKLLLCFYEPIAGNLYVQFSNGEEEALNISHRPLFAYVPQGNLLMSGSIREIITFVEKDKTNTKKIQNALKIACADNFVSELEDGIDTVLGEYGAGLSEGQMQRLAIARAIYTDAPILLLDEVTSALDAETEKQVLANIKSMTDKTVLIVTHRPAALDICNRIIEILD